MMTADELVASSSINTQPGGHVNHRHKELIKRITNIVEQPKDQNNYAEWIKADAHLGLLRDNATENELIIYASNEKTFFINTVAIDEDIVSESNLDIEDLLNWSGNPFHSYFAAYTHGGGRNDVWIERDPPICGSETLAKARQRHLIFGRVRYDRPMSPTGYFEVSQEYTSLSDIHFYPEHSSYCRYNDRGDLEHVVTITAHSDSERISLVTFRWEQLEQYLVASRCVLIRMFEFRLFTRDRLLIRDAFGGWTNTPYNVIKHQEIFYLQKVDGEREGYVRGVQIIRPRKPKQVIFETMKGHPLPGDHGNKYIEFIAYDFFNNSVVTISTNPMDTKDYFSANNDDRPYELSSAFFRAEVLSRYKADTDKYLIESRSIHCRGSWTLRDYDINDAGQVHAYICYLRNLPYSEQIYWKGFNEPPEAGMSERAIRNDFLNHQWTDLTDPLERIKRLLRKWNETKVAWWKLRDGAVEDRVTLPVTDSKDEWANAFKNISILVIEGFSEGVIRAKLKEKQIKFDGKQDKSITLLEKLVTGNTYRIQKLEGLRLAQRIRSKVDAHARGKEADQIVDNAIREFGSLTEHFKSVCGQIIIELEAIERAFVQEGLAEESRI